MGYNIYVTRKENWFDDHGPEITLEEWIAFVESDDEMRHDGFAELTLPDSSTLRREDEGIAVWTGYSRHGAQGNLAWIYHANGSITVKNPDEEIMQKLASLAHQFGAKVQGDDGEIYDADGRVIAPTAVYPNPDLSQKPWWKFW